MSGVGGVQEAIETLKKLEEAGLPEKAAQEGKLHDRRGRARLRAGPEPERPNLAPDAGLVGVEAQRVLVSGFG